MDDIELFKKEMSLVDLEQVFLDLDQVECPIAHHFAGQTYVREMFMPAGTLVVGKRHRYEGLNILLEGKVSIFVDRDQPVMHLEGPAIIKTEAFRKKLLYSHTDVRFCNLHKVDTQDLAEIEADVIITETEFQNFDQKEMEK